MTSTDAAPPESIDASSTKWFFVEMLIRDVDLVDAVIDLIDNSVDAARADGSGDLTGAEVLCRFTTGSSARWTTAEGCRRKP